jgi:pimeloyl-ACP methyl ester carboxylesterase
VRLFDTWKADGSGEALQTFPKDRRAVASDGTRLAYALVVPTEPKVPILYVNGWSCPDVYWTRVAWGLIGQGHPAVVPSQRGLGASGLPRRPGLMGGRLRDEDISIARLARDLIDVLDHAEIPRAVFMAHSMGVQIMLEAWRHAAERIVALVSVAGHFRNPVATFADAPVLDRIYPWADLVIRRIPLEWFRWSATFVPAWLVHSVAVAAGVGSPRLGVGDMAAHALQIASSNPSVLWRITSALRAHSAEDLLPKITVPVLILAGRQDYFMPPHVQAEMHRLIPRSELEWFEDGTHLLPVDVPVQIIEKTADFLERRLRG